MNQNDEFTSFFESQSRFGRKISLRYAFSRFSQKKWNFYVYLDPFFCGRDWAPGIYANVDPIFTVFEGILENGSVATFSDVYGVSYLNFDIFKQFVSRMKVINPFKAKMEAVRERNSGKVENGPF